MDKHFVETNPRHNIPVLLALADVWNDTLLGASSSRMITPFSESMVGFPAFCAALEAQTCSRARNSSSSGSTTATAANAGTFWNKPTCSSLVLDGGVDGAYDRSLYQSPTLINSEIVAVMDNQVYFNTARTIGANNNMEDVHTAQDAVMCSLFAHCDELAFGSERSLENTHPSTPPSFSMSSSNKPEGGEVLEGNRASMLLMCGKLDAFACGQLVALAEHRAVVKAHIWGIDPFVREVGSSLRANRMDSLKEELQHLFTKKPEAASGGNLSLSTKTMLEHYATLMQDTRTKR